ncbi:hypothetical protein BGX31_001422 [Mortierella sp. GBA43]|nr:hypothetical protein BGX31_001422 [Mortierella sp. GBA43]
MSNTNFKVLARDASTFQIQLDCLSHWTSGHSSGASAVRLAVSEINASRLIPGAYITLVLKDSFNGLDPDNSGAAQAIFSTVALLQRDGGVAGVIGDVSSALSLQSALLTSRLSIPQCSYSAGSTQLSSKEDYSHFFRTIPTELRFPRVMLDFVLNRGWKTIAVLYTGDSLGSQMMDNIEIEAGKRNITIGYRRSFWEQGASSDVGPALDALRDSGLRIILVAAVNVPQTRLMIEAVHAGLVSKNYVWLTINQVTEPLLGSSSLKPMDLNGLFMFDNLLKLDGYSPYETFLDKWAALNPTEYPYAGKRDISGNEPQAYSCMMTMAYAFANIARGNWTAIHMLAAGKLGDRLRPIDMNVNYTGPGGPMVFDENGDVIYGNYIIYNFQNGNVVSIGTSYSGEFNLTAPPMYFDGSYNTPADTAPWQVINPKSKSPIGLVITSVAGIGILFSVVTMVVVVIYRDAKVIKASSPLFCCLELCGFILLYTSTILGVDIPTRYSCMARPLTLDIGFVLVVSNIVAKNFRVYRIFHNIYVAKRVIKDTHLLKIVGSFLFGNLIIMITWFFMAPPTIEQIMMPDFKAYWACSDSNKSSTPFFALVYVYNGIILLIATYLAYKNRNVAANYNECRQIAFVVYNILLSGCLAVPTIFLPHDQFLTKFILSSVVILFGTTFSLMFLFLPKLWELFTQSERGQQFCNKNAGPDDSDEGSTDGFIYNSGPGWMNSSGNLGVLGKGVVGIVNANGSRPQLQEARKASVGTLDDTKDETLKEMHMGFMGVKFQYRYLSVLSNWRMLRVILYPSGRYFTCFEPDEPEAGRTYTYRSVSIDSRAPGAYVLRLVGNRCDFLFQVRDEERLVCWYNLFDNKQQANKYYANSVGTEGLMRNGDFSMGDLVATCGTPGPASRGSPSVSGIRGLAPDEFQTNESDHTLNVPMTHMQGSSSSSRIPSEKITVSIGKRSSCGSTQFDLSPSTLYNDEFQQESSSSGKTLSGMVAGEGKKDSDGGDESLFQYTRR